MDWRALTSVPPARAGGLIGQLYIEDLTHALTRMVLTPRR